MSGVATVLLRAVTALLLLSGLVGIAVDATDLRTEAVRMAGGEETADRIAELQRNEAMQEQLFGSATPETVAELEELETAVERLLPFAFLPATLELLVSLLAVSLGLTLLVRLPGNAAARALALLLAFFFHEDFDLLPVSGPIWAAEGLVYMIVVLRFATLFPRPLTEADVLRASSGMARRVAWLEAQLLHWRGLVLVALTTAVLYGGLISLARAVPQLRTPLLAAAILMITLPLFEAARLMRIGYHTATAVEKRSGLWVIHGFVFLAWAMLLATVLFLTVTIWQPYDTLFVRLMVQDLATNLLLLAGMGGLTLSLAFAVFYRGAIDPGLMIRKTTLYGAVGLLMVVTFVALEEFISAYIVDLLGLPHQAGGWLAGSAVALLFGRVRERVENHTNRLVDRLIPATVPAEAERFSATVVYSDLVSFASAPAAGEALVLTGTALFHAASRESAERHHGRLVKTIEDAVILEFEDPVNSVLAAVDTRRRYEQAAVALGMQPMQVRTGISCGEVAHARDGDVFGDVVDTASQLHEIAGAGCIVAIEAVTRGLDLPSDLEIVPLGTHALRGVRNPVPCFEIRVTASIT